MAKIIEIPVELADFRLPEAVQEETNRTGNERSRVLLPFQKARARSAVVLMGVLVIATFTAAIMQIMPIVGWI